MSLDLDWIRKQFPALTHEINGQSVIFFDGPGGTQVPKSVIDAMSDYLLRSNANAHGAFATSARTDAIITSARAAIADFLGCDRLALSGGLQRLQYDSSGKHLTPLLLSWAIAVSSLGTVISMRLVSLRGWELKTVAASCGLDLYTTIHSKRFIVF